MPGYDIAGWSRAADKTGGDYFDWQVLPDGRVLISLADVTGHGIGPALMAAVCRAYARATTQEEDLGRYMDRLNQLLMDDMPEGRFITFVGVLIDPESHQVQMISAGHGPLFRCVHANGELIESGADGVPLGLIPQNEYGTATKFSLDPGDSVLLITDGLFEWPNASWRKLWLGTAAECHSCLALRHHRRDDPKIVRSVAAIRRQRCPGRRCNDRRHPPIAGHFLGILNSHPFRHKRLVVGGHTFDGAP